MISCKCDCTQAPPAKVVEESSSEEESSDEEPAPKKAAPNKAAVPAAKAESSEEESSEEESDDEDEVGFFATAYVVQDPCVLVHARQKRWLEDMANRMMAWSLLQAQALKLMHDRIMMLDLAKPWWLHCPQPTCACYACEHVLLVRRADLEDAGCLGGCKEVLAI